ncbi:uncharacterized protein LOC120843269 [Ixodes scapularis]|uniref:uncharacterized protein LOC120843269 n=1 Tax=Ixodes scapularis TaxID=6945 RepID=UPI001A9D0FF7|nr:uncharacterized protein LOC120843269 [Ixodes scapularis]
MVLKDDCRPVVQPARRVPHALREPLKDELDRMTTSGIIAKVQEPTDWVSTTKEGSSDDVELHAATVLSTLEEPLLLRETPLQPWARIGADLCMYAGKSYLVLYDAYSNFPEVAELRDTTSKTVIDVMASMFSRHGLPLEVCTDGGPQFIARDFTEFAAKYDFKHTKMQKVLRLECQRSLSPAQIHQVPAEASRIIAQAQVSWIIEIKRAYKEVCL